jgi:tetratricopeptide (TPR) repeat protein
MRRAEILRAAAAVVTLALMASLSGPAQAQEGRCDQDVVTVEGCTALIRSGRYKGADLAAAYNNRGGAHMESGQTADAITDFSKAIQLKPDYAEAFNGRAVAYGATGDNAKALADYDEAIRLAPDFAVAFDGRCWTRALMGLLPEALADCNEALLLRPGHVATLDTRGLVFLKMRDYPDAVESYDAALHQEPRLASALYGRGLAQNGMVDGAGDSDIAAAKEIDADVAARPQWSTPAPD